MSTVSPPRGLAFPVAPEELAPGRANTSGERFADWLRAKNSAAPPALRNVEPKATPLGGAEAADALASAWKTVTGERPSKDTVSILTAQWSLETGRGQSMMNYNFGGIKGTGPSGLTTAYRTHEGSGETERSLVDHFRAYESAEEGATDYVRLLAKRYPTAVSAARTGDPGAFVHALKSRGYFTGDEGDYTRAIEQLSGLAREVGFEGAGYRAEWDTRDDDVYALASITQAFSDELAGAAIRIAAQPPRDEDDEASVFGGADSALKL